MAAHMSRPIAIFAKYSGTFTRSCVRLCSSKMIIEDDTPVKSSWLTNLLRGGNPIDVPKDSHSRLLADRRNVYEILTHDVKPAKVQDYLKSYGEYVEGVSKMGELKGKMNLVGSWMVDVGDQDQAVHIWEYPDYNAVTGSRSILSKNPEMNRRNNERVPMIRSRKSQLCLAFSFWGPIQPRAPTHIYEMRTYTLKPGTMIEWGNNWARGIRYRQKNNEAVAGFFAQIGQLYSVHHLWAYKDFEVRKETREAAWGVPGWDDVVAYTVPLMRNVEASILVPNTFSPLQ